MSFRHHAATLAALSLCVASLIGISSPGWASEMDKTSISTVPLTALMPINGNVSTKVPWKPTPEIPGVTVQKLPDDSADVTAGKDADTNEDVEFASLAAAVAAQEAPETVDDELACLAGAIYFESKGEPLSGQLAVADVIINRTKSGQFASTICGVVTQPGQFSFVRGGRMPAIDTHRKSYRTALAVAQVALDNAWNDPAPDALYFHAKRVRPGWGKTKVASIGHHIFYR
ncbi:MAG TPA: cell wall hydrolase [Sphingomonas sp.]|nr:cell wall hydrolase [Sphingomonas sp.]